MEAKTSRRMYRTKEDLQREKIEEIDKILHEPEMTEFEKRTLECYEDDEDAYANGKVPRLGTLKTVVGHILDSNDEYILRVCDCISTKSQSWFDQEFNTVFPFADPYSRRQVIKGFRDLATTASRPKPGDIQIFKNPSNKYDPHVVAFFCQICPGRPFTGINKHKRFLLDDLEHRLTYFKMCLDKLGNLHPDSIALNEFFGCIANREEWPKYCEVLDDFSEKHKYCQVRIFRNK